MSHMITSQIDVKKYQVNKWTSWIYKCKIYIIANSIMVVFFVGTCNSILFFIFYFFFFFLKMNCHSIGTSLQQPFAFWCALVACTSVRVYKLNWSARQPIWLDLVSSDVVVHWHSLLKVIYVCHLGHDFTLCYYVSYFIAFQLVLSC